MKTKPRVLSSFPSRIFLLACSLNPSVYYSLLQQIRKQKKQTWTSEQKQCSGSVLKLAHKRLVLPSYFTEFQSVTITLSPRVIL